MIVISMTYVLKPNLHNYKQILSRGNCRYDPEVVIYIEVVTSQEIGKGDPNDSKSNAIIHNI